MILGLVGGPGRALAQGQPAGSPPAFATMAVVRVSERGIGDAAFLTGSGPDLSAAAGILFVNTSTSMDVVVVVGDRHISLPQGDQYGLTRTELAAQFPNAAQGHFSVEPREGTAVLPDSQGRFRLAPSAADGPAGTAENERILPLTTDRDTRGTVASYRVRRQDSGLLMAPPPSAIAPTVDDCESFSPIAAADRPRPRKITIPLNGVGVDDWDFRNLRNPPYLLNGDSETGDWGRRFRCELRSQSLSLEATDPKTAAAIREEIANIQSAWKEAQDKYEADRRTNAAAKPPEDPWLRLALLRYTDIEFVNQSVDRVFTITADIPTPGSIAKAKTGAARDQARADFEVASGVKLGDCSATCRVVISLPYQTPKTFGLQWLAGAHENRQLDFSVWYATINKAQPAVSFSVNFFDEAATPAESTAYVALVPYSSLVEATSKTGWALSPTISAVHEPLVTKTSSFSAAEPFSGDVRQQLTGNANLTLKQTLGSRADAVVEFSFKSGALGEKDYDGSVKASTYQVNVYSVPGMRLSFGKFRFASAANVAAVREVGEGFRLNFRNNVAASYIVKRESAAGVADGENEDHRSIVVEANNLVGRTWPALRGLSVLALYGQDKAPKTKHDYWTAGFDLPFSLPDSTVSGTLAYYHSQRKPLGALLDPPLIAGRGDVGFATLGYTFFRKQALQTQLSLKVARSFRGEFGRGSGDRLDTASRDEGYLGETAAFAPDVIFLSTFAGKLSGIAPRANGLSNKQYYGAVYQDETWTPLDIVPRIIGIPETDISSRLLRVAVRSYLFSRDVAEGNAERYGGRELLMESQIETPAGVKASVKLAHFRPGPAVSAYFERRGVWSMAASLTVTLGN